MRGLGEIQALKEAALVERIDQRLNYSLEISDGLASVVD